MVGGLKGFCVFVSSEKIGLKEVLSLYYLHQVVGRCLVLV